MDNLQDNATSNADSSEDNGNARQGPMKKASKNTRRSREGTRPVDIIPAVKNPISVNNAPLMPAQFAPATGGVQAVPSTGDIIKSMLRFKWTIIVVFLLLTIPAIIAIWTLVVPKYQAQAKVRVRPIIPYLVFQTEESGKIPLYDAFVNTQVSIIMSPLVLQRVLDQQDIQQTQWYRNPPKSLMSMLRGNTPSLLDSLQDNLSARPRKDTEIIDVSFTNPDPNEARLIVNTILDQYMRYIGEMTDATQDTIYDQLLEQYKSLENEIAGRESTAAGLRKDLGTGSPDELISGMRIRLEETESRLSQVRQNIALLEWEINQATADDSNDISTPAAGRIQSQPKYYEDEEWRRLDNNVRIIRHNIKTSLLTPNHPDAIKAQQELKFAEEQLKLREEQLDEQLHDRLSNTTGASIAAARGMTYEEGLIYLQHQLARSNHEEELLVKELENQSKEFENLFASAQLLENENNTLQHKRELFTAVRQRRDQKTMERNVPGSIEILTRAILPTQPYYDRRIAFSFMVMIMALGLGGGLAYLKANKTQAIYTPKDMPLPMHVPFLGYVSTSPVGGLLYNEASPATVESIRVVRTALLSLLNGKTCPEPGDGYGNTVLVTSAAEGTGKSTFTMMLGESLARSGREVLLIDADFRKMTLTKQFNLSGKPGFIQTLCSKTQERYYIFKTQEIPGLSFMPAGKLADIGVAFEETANAEFKVHFDKLRNKYDFILLDSPPVLPVADAVILSNQVDGIIIVERELISHRTDVINAFVRLSSAGGHLLGTVFIGSSEQKNYV